MVGAGYGYDTRAYRLGSLDKVTKFEVDQHCMSLKKQKKCRDAIPVCKELTHVSTNFNKERVADALLNSPRFDRSLPTFFLWESAAVCLSDESVDEIFANLREIHKVTNTAHYLYFTFRDKRIIDEEARKKIYGREEFFNHAAGLGEKGLSNGLDPSRISQYLADRGFTIYDLFLLPKEI
jgi:methyltransferase (TIGR00027 family)